MEASEIIEIVRLAKVSRGGHTSLVEAIARAKRAVGSQGELRLLCQEAFERSRDLEHNRTGR